MPTPAIITAILHGLMGVSFGLLTISSALNPQPEHAPLSRLCAFTIAPLLGFVLLFVRTPFSRWYSITLLLFGSGWILVLVSRAFNVRDDLPTIFIVLAAIPLVLAILLLVLAILLLVSTSCRGYYGGRIQTKSPPPLENSS
jgi:hypothetical protein